MRPHLKHLFLFLSLGFGQVGIAQDLQPVVLAQIDSINHQIKNAKTEEEKIKSICHLGKIYRNSNQFEPSIKTYKSALGLVNGDEFPNRYAKISLEIGEQYLDNRVFKIDSALAYTQNAYLKFNLLEEEYQIRCLRTMTGVHYALFRFEDAMKYCIEGIELTKKTGRKKSLQYFYMNMAIFCSIYLNDLDRTIEFSTLALNLAIEIGDNRLIAKGYFEHGINLSKIEDYSGTLSAYDSSEKYLDPNLEQELLLDVNLCRADIYVLLEDYDVAKRHYNIAWEIANKEDVWNRKMHVPMGLADLAIIQGELDKAIELSNEALAIVPDKLTLYELERGNLQLYKAYKKKNKFEEALHYFEIWQEYQDSMSRINNLGTIAGLESKYKNQEQKQQIEFQQTEIKNQKEQKSLFRSLLATLSVLMIGLTVLLIKIRNSRKRIKLQHETITHQAEELKHLDKVKSRFFANVSHELRTPLTLMLGPINAVLKNKNLDDEDLAFIKTAKKNGNELFMLTKSILDLSKMETGKLPVFEQAENLFKITRKVVGLFESVASEKNIRFMFIFEAEKKLQLLLDRNKIETIFKNLISNAVKFTNPGGEVKVKIEDLNDTVLFKVSDNGRGVSPKELPHIFDRYFQTKNPEALAEGGSGIGLSLSKELANLLGGSIWVESKEGEGSTFYFKFPKKEVIEKNKATKSFDYELEAATRLVSKKSKPTIPVEPVTSIVLTEEEELWIKKVEQLLKEQLSNHQFSIFQLAEEMALSERQIRRRIKKIKGISPAQFLKETRLVQAKKYLEEKKYKTVSQVAMSVGFQDPGGFSRNFFQRFGTRPSSYLKNETLKD